MASEQTAVLHSQERPVYINKGSALTQNLIFSAALVGAGTYGLLALQHTLRTGSQWVDATAPNGYSLYQFAYGVIGSVIQNFKIDKAMAALLGKAYDFDRFCRIGGGLLLASLISIVAVLLVTVVYNIVNLALDGPAPAPWALMPAPGAPAVPRRRRPGVPLGGCRWPGLCALPSAMR